MGGSSRHFEHHVAPMFWIMCMTEPFISYGHTTGKTGPSINYNGPAMIPAMKACQLSELRSSEFFDSSSSLFEVSEFRVRDCLGSETVQQQTNFHTFFLFPD